MSKKVLTIVELNLRNIQWAYVLTAIPVLLTLFQFYIPSVIAAWNGDDTGTARGASIGYILCFLIIVASITIPKKNYSRFISLGCNRMDFFWGTLLTYVLLSLVVSLAGAIVYCAVDLPLINNLHGLHNDSIYSLHGIFGWDESAPIVLFFRSFSVLFLFSAIIHTLVVVQSNPYGKITLFLIIASVLLIFSTLSTSWFLVLQDGIKAIYGVVLLHEIALLQITMSLALGCLVYCLNIPINKRKC